MSERKFFGDSDQESFIGLPALPEDIKEFAGLWVAIRDHQVISVAKKIKGITKSETYNPAIDALYHVPEPGDHYYSRAA